MRIGLILDFGENNRALRVAVDGFEYAVDSETGLFDFLGKESVAVRLVGQFQKVKGLSRPILEQAVEQTVVFHRLVVWRG